MTWQKIKGLNTSSEKTLSQYVHVPYESSKVSREGTSFAEEGFFYLCILIKLCQRQKARRKKKKQKEAPGILACFAVAVTTTRGKFEKYTMTGHLPLAHQTPAPSTSSHLESRRQRLSAFSVGSVPALAIYHYSR